MPIKIKRRVNIDDLAAKVGVSPATVSRALNNSPLVREELRLRIRKAAEQLGYTAHGAARALATQRSLAVGAIIPTITHGMFARIVDGLQQRLHDAGYVLLLATSNYNAEREYNDARVMIERSVDAMMIVGAEHDPRLYTMLKGSNLPFVQAVASAASSSYPSIGYDHNTVARLVVNYLVGLGHREFGMVVGHASLNDRVTGYLAAVRRVLAELGYSLPSDRVVHRSYSVEDGREALREMSRRGALPTAIISGNDTLAFGLVHEALVQGIDVPGALSVIGLGDLEFAANVARPLTTIRTPKDQIGRLAAEYLLGRIEGKNVKLPGDLPVELIKRGTSGKLSKARSVKFLATTESERLLPDQESSRR